MTAEADTATVEAEAEAEEAGELPVAPAGDKPSTEAEIATSGEPAAAESGVSSPSARMT